jgi:hypothetical protein
VIPSVVAVGIDARRRLADLGLAEEPLLDVVRRGFAAAAACTANHPIQLPGILAWGETICALREYLLPVGWQRADDGLLPLTANRSGTHAITVATGDEDTGRVEGSPCTKSKKGPLVQSAVSVNHLQLEMFPMPVALRGSDATGRMTWLLLIHRDRSAHELRAELSQPISVGEDSRVDGWAERIILKPIPFDEDLSIAPAPAPSGPDVVVEIKRRA